MNSSSPMPGDREETSRRQFLKIFTGIIGFFIAIVLAVPLLSSLLGPLLRRKKDQWTKVGKLPELGSDHPVNISFSDQGVDAYIRENITRDIWVVKLPTGELTVYSPVCTHLGCHYNWDAAKSHFVCPCHGSFFALNGAVLGGPAPRPLDSLPAKVENGELYIEWERFEPGTPRKIRV
jgi:menaquinol-cytochrome c reductase iron-sulfur subunit